MKKGGVLFWALVGLCAWHLALRWHGFSLPLISDEGEYAYQARLLSEGGVPYRDAYNQKPPGVFFIYRASYALLDGRDWAPRASAVLFSWLTMVFLFLLSPSAWIGPARLTAPAVYATLSTQPVGDMGFAANTEVFLAAFTAMSAWCIRRSWRDAWRGWPVLAGLACGAAVMTKQTALWSLLAFGAAAAGSRWRELPRRAGLYAAGCAVLPGFVYLYFASRGASREFLEQAFTRNMDYAAILVRSGAWRDQIEWFARTVVPQFLRGGWPVYAAAALGLAATRLEARRAEEILATLWLGSALIGCATGLFLFPHYFLQAYPPLAFLAGAGIQRLGESRSGARYASGLVAALCLYPVAAHARTYFVESPERTARRLLYPNPLFEVKILADYIRSRANETDRMYVFGSEPQLYRYAGLRAATEHIFVYPLTLFPRGYQKIWEELRRLETRPPRFIVYVQQGASTLIATREGEVLRSGVISLLTRRYRWIGTVDMRPEGSRAFFMEHGLGPGGAEPLMPDWSSRDRIYLFEARAAGNQ